MSYFIIILSLGLISFITTKRHYIKQTKSNTTLKSIPNYYGYCTTIWTIIAATVLLIIFLKANITKTYLFLLLGAVTTLALNYFFHKKLSPAFHARKHFEKIFMIILKIISIISIAVTFFIVASILLESLRFFSAVPLHKFLFGTHWSPQFATDYNSENTASSFGAVPIIVGTLLITTIAIVIAVPFGLFSAIYLTEYSNTKFRKIIKPTLEILAGVPTVVYGYFAAFTVAPLLQILFAKFNITIASESALTAGIVMGIMIIPFVLSLSDDVMNAVPNSLRDASLALGSTKSESIKKVVIPAALPGIIGAILLAISRAIGETMIVTMAAGLNANLSFNPLESVTTATVQIVTLLVGDQEFDSVKTLSAFALGITLFTITLFLNLIALIIVKKYRAKYE